MGTSDSTQIPAVLRMVSEVAPASILDLGIGRGRYGALFRLTFEADSVELTDREKWTIRIDGVEGFAAYVGEIQRSIYSQIVVAPIADAVPVAGQYDVILLADVIEHFEKEEGRRLLRSLIENANKRVVIVTPNGPYEQGALFGNEYERHRSWWIPADFLEFPNPEIYIGGKTIVAAFSKEPLQLPGRRWRLGERFLRRYPLSARLRAWAAYRFRKALRS